MSNIFIDRLNVIKHWLYIILGKTAVTSDQGEDKVYSLDIPGVMEATRLGETCIDVPRKSPDKLAQAIYKMYIDEDQRRELGLCGRRFVCETYELNQCFEKVEHLYQMEG